MLTLHDVASQIDELIGVTGAGGVVIQEAIATWDGLESPADAILRVIYSLAAKATANAI